ncbi:hypothetical protein [Xanthomonas phage vB_XooS_NR08]|nr:hypothetical protein [Xanthomonas phage vB_XooS_NR08]
MAENQPTKRRGRPSKATDSVPATDVAADRADERTEAPAASEAVSDDRVEAARKQVAFQSIEHYLQHLAKEKSK